MAKGIFTAGFTVREVLEIQTKAKEALKAGRVVMSYSDSGTSVSKAAPMPVADVLDECAHALRVLDPATYGRRPRVAVGSYMHRNRRR